MILTVLSVVALSVGVIHSSADWSDAEQLAAKDQESAIVQVVPPQEESDYPQLGL